MADDDQAPVRYADWQVAVAGLPMSDPTALIINQPSAIAKPDAAPIPDAMDQAPGSAAQVNWEKGLRRWWYGGDMPLPRNGGDLPEADMTNDPVSRAIKGAISLPQRFVEAGKQDAANFMQPGYAPQAAAPAAEVAMMLMGGLPFAGKNTAGVFGGRLAATADHAALSRAEQMAAKGASQEEIHAATGWFQGPDRQWRFEIPDNVSHMKGTGSVGDLTARRGNQLGDVFYHSKLYEAYPEIKDTPIFGSNGGSNLAYDPITGSSINISNKSGVPRQTILHEVQHEIQRLENFAPGGTPTNFSQGAIEQYKRLAGEVEARNVETRMNMSHNQRSQNPPWNTQDTPFENQLVLNSRGGPIFTSQRTEPYGYWHEVLNGD
jgi:hypothetical protein